MIRDWQAMDVAPRDGTEVLGRDANGGTFLVAWAGAGTKLAPWAEPGTEQFVSEGEGGWHRRAGGAWSLYDGAGPQFEELTRWCAIPEEPELPAPD
jgi:hypothetical protein